MLQQTTIRTKMRMLIMPITRQKILMFLTCLGSNRGFSLDSASLTSWVKVNHFMRYNFWDGYTKLKGYFMGCGEVFYRHKIVRREVGELSRPSSSS